MDAGAHERARALATAVDLLTAIGMPDGGLAELRARVRGVVERVVRGGPGADTAPLDELAAELVALDARMPTTWFRHQLPVDKAEREQLLGYAAVLGRYAGAPDQIDRVELIACRLLTADAKSGLREPLPDEQVMPILERVAAGRVIDEARRDAAVRYFAECAERLDGMRTVEQIFGEGLYLDLKGYKRALGADRLDPAVLYASVLLSTAFTNHLRRYAARDQQSAARIEKRTAADNQAVDEIYRKLELDPVSLRFEHERELAEAANKRRPKTSPFAPRFDARKVRAAALAAAVAAGVSLVVVMQPHDVVLADKSALAHVARATELKLSGGVARTEHGRVFLGVVDASQWSALAPVERGVEAARLAEAFGEAGVVAAVVRAGDRLALQIDGGRVVFVGDTSVPSRVERASAPANEGVMP